MEHHAISAIAPPEYLLSAPNPLTVPGLYFGIGERLEPIACVLARIGGKLLAHADGDRGWSSPATRYPHAVWLARSPLHLPDLPEGWVWAPQGGWLRGYAERLSEVPGVPAPLRLTVRPAVEVSSEAPFDPAAPTQWKAVFPQLCAPYTPQGGVADTFAAALVAATVAGELLATELAQRLREADPADVDA